MIGRNTNLIKFDTEGSDANGREIVLRRSESPTRVDEVNDSLIYLRWVELGRDNSE